MKKKLGQDPAFPLSLTSVDNGTDIKDNQEYDKTGKTSGMTKRFYAACMILQSLLTTQENYNQIGFDEDDAVYYTKIAYKFADELLKQENL